jgi:hypothetical protein
MPPYSPDGSVDHGAPCVRCRCPRWKHKHDGYCQNGACSCNTFKGTTRYRNPWHRPDKPEYGPAEYETDAAPTTYRGFLLYHRVRSTQDYASGAHVFDVVQNGACLTQCAGPDGARRAIDAIIDAIIDERSGSSGNGRAEVGR